MAVGLKAPTHLTPVAGVRIGVTQGGIRKANRDDVTVFEFAAGTAVAGVFTLNRYCAAPVTLSKRHLLGGNVRALLVNTGCANAGTGEEGMQRAQASCQALAAHMGLQAAQVLPFSTGVIMEPLPIDRLTAALPAALANLGADNWVRAAGAIMTTDTLPKGVSETLQLGGKTVTISGISKGAGMIRPNMATMLGFIATDAAVSQTVLTALTQRVADVSFNRITVDGDTSTNDSFIVAATGAAGNAAIDDLNTADGTAFAAALTRVAQRLAQAIVRDGEGATKFLTITVRGGKTGDECLKAAYAIAHSPLVKTAFFASDPNLGRILAAVGYAGIADLDASTVDLYLDGVHVVQRGGRKASYQEADGQRVMKQSEITVTVDLGRGSASDTVWTCDLSHDYVTINADYRS